jgi:hypothetical protein
MLQLNAVGLSQTALKDAVLAQCSRFGCVSHVRVLAPHDYTAAVVRMSTQAETSKLLESLGEAMVEGSVFIWIE